MADDIAAKLRAQLLLSKGKNRRVPPALPTPAQTIDPSAVSLAYDEPPKLAAPPLAASPVVTVDKDTDMGLEDGEISDSPEAENVPVAVDVPLSDAPNVLSKPLSPPSQPPNAPV